TPPAPVAIVSEIMYVVPPLMLVSTLPPASSSASVTGEPPGLTGALANVFAGCVSITSLAGDPTTTVIVGDVALGKPLADAVRVYPEPTLSSVMLLNVAVPAEANSVADPPSVAPEMPVPLVIPNVI